jgi:hypothetical protein
MNYSLNVGTTMHRVKSGNFSHKTFFPRNIVEGTPYFFIGAGLYLIPTVLPKEVCSPYTIRPTSAG